jgi:hypothetical protein
MTVAPAALASWMAASPTPPAPACTRTVSPACSRPNSNRQSWAVANSIGTPAACSTVSPSGSTHTDEAGTPTSSAWEPAIITATTSSPTATPSTRSPTARTVPAAW